MPQVISRGIQMPCHSHKIARSPAGLTLEGRPHQPPRAFPSPGPCGSGGTFPGDLSRRSGPLILICHDGRAWLTPNCPWAGQRGLWLFLPSRADGWACHGEDLPQTWRSCRHDSSTEAAKCCEFSHLCLVLSFFFSLFSSVFSSSIQL